MGSGLIKPEWKQKWVTALRSGEYKQGFRGVLKDAMGNYCCLGVLEYLVLKEHPEIATRYECPVGKDGVIGLSLPIPLVADFVTVDTFPNREEARNPGIEVTEEDRVKYKITLSGPVPLAVLNDNLMPFTKLADLIEAQL